MFPVELSAYQILNWPIKALFAFAYFTFANSKRCFNSFMEFYVILKKLIIGVLNFSVGS